MPKIFQRPFVGVVAEDVLVASAVPTVLSKVTALLLGESFCSRFASSVFKSPSATPFWVFQLSVFCVLRGLLGNPACLLLIQRV